MARRKKIPDRHNAGRSEKVPYIRGEKASTRHWRRLHENLSESDNAQKWCDDNGFVFKISNGGQHWQFTKNGFTADWWPSSAKLVIDKQWNDGIHCHDYEQVIGIIDERYTQAAQSDQSSKVDKVLLGQIPETGELEFLEEFLFELTITFRALAEDDVPCESLVRSMSLLNEISHCVLKRIRDLRQGAHWSAHNYVPETIEKYTSEEPMISGYISRALTRTQTKYTS